MAAKTPDNRLTFKLNGFTPQTLPLNVFAEYVSGLAALLGNPKDCHFVRVGKGSAKLVHDVDRDAIPEVRQRIHNVQLHEAPQEVLEAFFRVNQLLVRDRTTASISLGPSKLIEFPGSKMGLKSPIGPISQPDYLDGQLIRIGGKDETVPVQIRDEDGQIYSCTANVALARELSPYLYRQTIRLNGTGSWFRYGDGKWVLHFFRIDGFDKLDDSPMADAVAAIRNGITAPEWPENIHKSLAELRDGE